MLIKFALVGLSGVGLNMAVYAYLLSLNADYLTAAICSFSVAVTNNFVWNMLWTFRGRAKEKNVLKKYVNFFAISFINLVINLFVLHALVKYSQVDEKLSQLLSIAVVCGLNFLLNYRITFGEKSTKQQKEAPLSYEANCYTHLQ